MNRRSFLRTLAQSVATAAAMAYCPKVLAVPEVVATQRAEMVGQFTFNLDSKSILVCRFEDIDVLEQAGWDVSRVRAAHMNKVLRADWETRNWGRVTSKKCWAKRVLGGAW